MAEPVQNYDWRFFTDQVMGGVSEGKAELAAQGLHLTGLVRTANNGGFIQARAETGPFAPENQGIRIRVKGDGQRYFLHLRSRATRLPWQYYQAGFDTDGTWQDITLPFSAFTGSGRLLPRQPRPETITSVALVAYGRDHTADIWLSDLTPLR
jgi:Complex I intermediate-associated protein 30 (CIA30).